MTIKMEIPLRKFLQRNTNHCSDYCELALSFVDWIKSRHESGYYLHAYDPDCVHIQYLKEGFALRVAAVSAEIRDDMRQSASDASQTYLSPEHAGRMKHIIDHRSDMYVLGMIFYEMFTGEKPFQAETANEWRHAHLAVLPSPMRSIRPHVPEALDDIVMKLLSKKPEDRYQTVFGLYDDMRNCRDQLRDKGVIAPFTIGIVDELCRFQLPTGLYGRHEETRMLQEVYESACSGVKSLAVIAGHPGSGKTALVRAFAQSVGQGKGRFIAGKADQINHSVPYAPLIMALRELIRQILTECEERIQQWRAKIMAAAGNSGYVLCEMIAELALIIGEQPPVEELPLQEATIRFQTLLSRFVKVFAEERAPLVLWIDNLHCADSATLHMLQFILHDPSNRHMLIIGTTRHQEWSRDSLLTQAAHRQSLGNTHIVEITLNPLDYATVTAYVTKTLRADTTNVKPLVDTLFQKTAGNPFHLKQMLQMIYKEGMLRFHTERRRWEWDLEAIRERKGFSDIASMITDRFNSLPAATRQVLGLASCIGNPFPLDILTRLNMHTSAETEEAVYAALSVGLIVREQDDFVFLHDHVQRTAYDLIFPAERERIHLEIGRLLSQLYQSSAEDDLLFDVVHHLNRGSRHMTESAEKEWTAELNLKAGRRAKASAAYDGALELLDQGVALVGGDGWSCCSPLYAQLLLERSECQYYCGDTKRAEAALEELLAHVRDPGGRARIYVTQINMYAFGKKEKKSAEIIFRAMAELGQPIPSKPSRLIMAPAIAFTGMWARKQKVPLNEDPAHKALGDIYIASSSILFITDASQAIALTTRCVRLFLKQRNREAFLVALGSLAIALCFGLKSYKAALRLVEMLVSHCETLDSVKERGKLYYMVAFVLQLLKPGESDDYFRKAEHLSLEAGDLVYAGYAISSRLILLQGDLNRLSRLCRQYEELAGIVLDDMTLNVLHIAKRYAQLLQDSAMADANVEQLTFRSEHFRESEFLKAGIDNDSFKSNLLYYYTCKLEVYYLYGHYTEAIDCAERSANYETATVLSFNQRYCFYYAMAMMARYAEAPRARQQSYRAAIRRLVRRMKQWAGSVPESALSKYWILQAEYARLVKKKRGGIKRYNDAIRQARAIGCTSDEAIAHELLAKLLMRNGEEQAAEFHLSQACKAYRIWGAEGKARQMREQYSVLRELEPVMRNDDAAPNGMTDKNQLWSAHGYMSYPVKDDPDLSMLRQATELDWEEGAEEGWQSTFVKMAMYNAGADKGILLLGKESQWHVIASETPEDDSDIQPSSSDQYSSSVVQFVMRSGEPVIIGNVGSGLFAADPYMVKVRPGSVLCMPVRYPDDSRGVLYLENHFTTHAFRSECLAILDLLFARLAYMGLHRTPQGDVLAEMKTSVASSQEEGNEPLTSRELEVLRLMAEGLSNKEIGRRLTITEGTVKIHASNIYGKLQVKRRAQAIAKGRELLLIG
ncbi:AAA family ATPase [Paenibacillus sp. J5C_2022]|uniref:AAA family ATPase n=1 Tax=Paenibacillus sp. J5C2022 TaxID=2977129 RepID=UPI0021CEA01B|nr:AAA family ATPase [Paenibacillus sp. J5C2022]MCU6710517.1 AAA family ATPase [Paenibacillus sp. J5C2022]